MYYPKINGSEINAAIQRIIAKCESADVIAASQPVKTSRS